VALRLHVPGSAVDESRRLDYEREDFFGFRWWPAQQIRISREHFYPGQLPAARCLPRRRADQRTVRAVVITHAATQRSSIHTDEFGRHGSSLHTRATWRSAR
jgi:hypothetical protein